MISNNQNFEMLKFFSQYIEKELGIIYGEHNYFQLQNRIEEIAKTLGYPDHNAFFLAAQTNLTKNDLEPKIKQLLLDTATNNETSFFRDPTSYAAFEELILKNLSTIVGPTDKLRIWSAACSTGQEPVSLAIKCLEYFEKQKISPRFSILATDVSSRVLARAKNGLYGELEIQRGMTPELKQKYFELIPSHDHDQREKPQYKTKTQVSNSIDYKNLNLKSDFYHAQKFHVIYCRNVLIYQNVPAKTKILKHLGQYLIPGGYLVLGAGETMMGLASDLINEYIQLSACGSVLYKHR